MMMTALVNCANNSNHHSRLLIYTSRREARGFLFGGFLANIHDIRSINVRAVFFLFHVIFCHVLNYYTDRTMQSVNYITGEQAAALCITAGIGLRIARSNINPLDPYQRVCYTIKLTDAILCKVAYDIYVYCNGTMDMDNHK